MFCMHGKACHGRLIRWTLSWSAEEGLSVLGGFGCVGIKLERFGALNGEYLLGKWLTLETG